MPNTGERLIKKDLMWGIEVLEMLEEMTSKNDILVPVYLKKKIVHSQFVEFFCLISILNHCDFF